MALSAKDLRIGNLLQYRQDVRVKPNLAGKTFACTADDILFLIENDVWYVDPVRLTEELLIKFGFEKYSGGYSSKDSVIELTFDFLVWKPSIKRLKVLYVHQLQNLYYAITGEELTI